MGLVDSEAAVMEEREACSEDGAPPAHAPVPLAIAIARTATPLTHLLSFRRRFCQPKAERA